jgi:hypothetical protein
MTTTPEEKLVTGRSNGPAYATVYATASVPIRLRVGRATMVFANGEPLRTARAVGAVQPVRRTRARASKAKTRWLSHK